MRISSPQDIPELYCEHVVQSVYGDGWRNLPQQDLDGALGIAMCRAILDGCRPELKSLSERLGVSTHFLYQPYERLSRNGFMKGTKISEDPGLTDDLVTAWCYVAGYASGATGIGSGGKAAARG